ncbi:MAG: hypothetical protein KJ072_03870 [Verrucomicrobia bacterium]|nr:hypothetical protein [Verrucomicrobiota bacterium]
MNGASRWPRFNLDATDGVDRVDYAINGTVFATVYGPPWEFAADPAEMVGTLGLSLGANRASAAAFDDTGGMVAAAESAWQAWFDGVPTEVRIEAPTPGYTIYTDDLVSPTHAMTIRVYAAYVRFWFEEGPAGGGR